MYQEDQYQCFLAGDIIKNLSDIKDKIFVHQNIHFNSTMIKSFFQVKK